MNPLALARRAASREVDAEPRGQPGTLAGPSAGRRRAVLIGGLAVVLIALGGGGVWWNRQVTADPGLEFYGGPNIYRDEASTDRSGIEDNRNLLGTETGIAFQPNGRLYVHFGLLNDGSHDVEIVAAPEGRYYYWGFDRMSLSADPEDGLVGVAQRYEPFQPFTLRRGDTVEVRLEFRLADCDPAKLQSGNSILRGLDLRYRILGVTRTVNVPFREAAVAVGAIGECTNPLVD